MGTSYGCNNYRLMASEIPSMVPGGAPTSIAAFMIHGEVFAEGQASSTKNAKIKASKSALGTIGKISLVEYRTRFGCDCKVQEEQWVGKDEKSIEMVGSAI